MYPSPTSAPSPSRCPPGNLCHKSVSWYPTYIFSKNNFSKLAGSKAVHQHTPFEFSSIVFHFFPHTSEILLYYGALSSVRRPQPLHIHDLPCCTSSGPAWFPRKTSVLCDHHFTLHIIPLSLPTFCVHLGHSTFHVVLRITDFREVSPADSTVRRGSSK